MKYLVFSDLHGSLAGLERLKAAVALEKPDVILCLGDVLFGAYDGDAAKCAEYLSDPKLSVIGVRGNTDHLYDANVLGFALPEEMQLYFAGHRLWMRHAPFWGDFRPGDVIMFGHTHIKSLDQHAGITTLNPGSIGKPRDGAPGYAVIEEHHIDLVDADNFQRIQVLAL